MTGQNTRAAGKAGWQASDPGAVMRCNAAKQSRCAQNSTPYDDGNTYQSYSFFALRGVFSPARRDLRSSLHGTQRFLAEKRKRGVR